ncbi:MAG: tRNA threonylcarbamoyladenosine dehydratase [Fibrobacterota bacterium]
MNGGFSRSLLLLGNEAFKKLQKKRIILFGLGGVGSWCAEALIRTGVRSLTLVDFDRVAPSNINRQLPAYPDTAGRLKADVLAERCARIAPDALVTVLSRRYSEKTRGDFMLSSYDYIIDAIDSVEDKVDLLASAQAAGVCVLSSMGAALKVDPLRVQSADISQTHTCRLAKIVRRKLRERGITTGIRTVFSDEQGANRQADGESGVNGSLLPVTGVFGFSLASLVVQDILKEVNDEQ